MPPTGDFWVKPKDCSTDAQILQVRNLTVKKTHFKQASEEVHAYQRKTQNLIFTDFMRLLPQAVHSHNLFYSPP